MKIKAAVLNAMRAALPCAQSRPLSIDEVELDPPGGDVPGIGTARRPVPIFGPAA
jgi:Zn-dependent alcohol dehydrogenase